MFCKLPALAAGAILLASLSGCSQQQPAAPSSSGPQVASANAGDKCEVDVKRVCQEMRKRPVVSSNGLTEDATEIEHEQPRTAREFMSYQIPNGSVVEISCEINTEHSSVVYAHMMPGPPLTPTDIAYFKNAGYCAH